MHKLLLADDSVTIRRVIELTFSGEDVTVVTVADGEEAVARIPVERPDIVLADIGMPRKGGYEVAAFVKGTPDLAHIPVLLLAGAFEPIDQARADTVGAEGILIKPFEPRHLIERVKALLTPPASDIGIVTAVAPLPAETTASDRGTSTAAEHDAPVGPAELSLDELFESLNQAIAAPATVGQNTVAAPPAPVRADRTTPRLVGADPVVALGPPRPTSFEVVANPEAESERPTTHGPEPVVFEPLASSQVTAGSLEDYFDRLTAAFSQSRSRGAVPLVRDDSVGAPASNLAGFALESAPGQLDPPAQWLASVPRTVATDPADANPILDAVATLTTGGRERVAEPGLSAPAEDGHVPADWGVRRPSTPPAVSSDDMVDAITERILQRLVPAVTESVRRLAESEVERATRGSR